MSEENIYTHLHRVRIRHPTWHIPLLILAQSMVSFSSSISFFIVHPWRAWYPSLVVLAGTLGTTVEAPAGWVVSCDRNMDRVSPQAAVAGEFLLTEDNE